MGAVCWGGCGGSLITGIRHDLENIEKLKLEKEKLQLEIEKLRNDRARDSRVIQPPTSEEMITYARGEAIGKVYSESPKARSKL